MTRPSAATVRNRPRSRLAHDLAQVRKLTLPDGTKIGDAFERDPWIEENIVRPILRRRKSGRPVHRDLVIQVHRGSSKTSTVANLALVMLDGEPFTEVVIVSLDKDGAREVTSVLRGLVLRQPSLAQVFAFRRDEVVHRANGSRLQILAADTTTAYSFGASARRVRIVIDEFSRHAKRDLYDSLASASAKFEDSQMILLSNGFVRPSWSLDIKDALKADPSAYVFEPPGLIASWVNPKNLASLKRRVPPQIYARDYLNEDVDSSGEDGLIPMPFLYGARTPVQDDGTSSITAGLDVAGPGEDETVLTLAAGGAILSITAWPDSDPRGQVIRALRRVEDRLEAVNVDSAGLGWGMYLALRDVFGDKVNAVNVGESPQGTEEGRQARELYANLKAQRYWALRGRFEAGEITGLLDELALVQLSTLRYETTPRGAIAIESKDAARKRGVKSPDRAESIMLALGGPVVDTFIGFGWAWRHDEPRGLSHQGESEVRRTLPNPPRPQATRGDVRELKPGGAEYSTPL